MHPIHYSVIYNVIAIIIAAILSYLFTSPWPFVVTLLLAQHTMERFRTEAQDDEEDEAQPIGFLQDLDSR